jgi:2-polyprenyl-3-methyl-5-hydroxy-6-metoxy-1,4-benzoquinol methylase
MTTWLHEERLRAVVDVVLAAAPRGVADLGCGGGDLFVRLAGCAGITRLVGLDVSAEALERLRLRLAQTQVRAGGVDLRLASMADGAPDLAGIDCAVLVETIEHLPAPDLARTERAVFRDMRPGMAVITTPNAEFNRLLGVPLNRFRHPGHRFEWTRAQFRAWGGRVAAQAGYGVTFHDIGGKHPDLGGASQMAVFRRDGA